MNLITNYSYNTDVIKTNTYGAVKKHLPHPPMNVGPDLSETVIGQHLKV